MFAEAGNASLLLDCGAGTVRTLARLDLPWQALTHLLITHFHTDHVGDLAALLFAYRHGLDSTREEPMYVIGPPGLGDHLTALSRAHGSFIDDPGFPLEVKELPAGSDWTDPRGDLRIKTWKTEHTLDSVAYRVETEAGALGYAGDTGPSQSLGSFFQGCQVLVAECSHPDGQGGDNHLTPTTLAAWRGFPHPSSWLRSMSILRWNPIDVPDLLDEAGYAGRVLAGRDGLCLEWIRRVWSPGLHQWTRSCERPILILFWWTDFAGGFAPLQLSNRMQV